MDADRSSGVSRRAFLTALGAAGGGGAVFGALAVLGLGNEPSTAQTFRTLSVSDFRLQGRENTHSVLVVGAGIAGLCCAYELQKAGYQVTVLDAGDRAGGRNWTARSGAAYTSTDGEMQRCDFGSEHWFNTGPARIAQHHTTLDYCRELNVPVEVFVNTNVDAYVESEGIVRRRRSVAADIDGYVAELLAKSITSGSLDDELTQAERAALLDHLRSIGAVGSPSRGFSEPPGVGPGTVDGPDDLETLLDLGIGRRVAFENGWQQAMPMFHPVGGMDRIVEALVVAIGEENIRLSSAATEIVGASDGVRVVVNEGDETIDADWGICCVQPELAASLANPWESRVRTALQEPTAVLTGKIGLEYDSRFWEDDGIFGGASVTNQDIRVLWYPSTGYLSAGGVVMGAYPFGGDAARFQRMRHTEREALAVRRGEAIHGDRYRADLISSFSVAWSSVPHIQSAWTSWHSYGPSYRLLQQPAGRWMFAGDWLSRTPGWQHGAFESARHAVTALHELAVAE